MGHSCAQGSCCQIKPSLMLKEDPLAKQTTQESQSMVPAGAPATRVIFITHSPSAVMLALLDNAKC